MNLCIVQLNCCICFSYVILRRYIVNLVFKPHTMSLDLPKTARFGTGRVHSDLNAKLRPYQRDGVSFLWDRVGRDAGGILCDDMGLGKTVQVIALLSALYEKTGTPEDKRLITMMKLEDRRVEPSLVICPGSVLCNWEAELNTWGQFYHLRYHRQERAATLTQARDGRVEGSQISSRGILL